jgi:outer membrane receptor protein involved in Fe transport
LYSNDEVFLLPRGSGERLPWQHSIDAKLSYTFFESPTKTLAVTLDVFNLFNFQAEADRSQRYKIRPVEPITGKSVSEVATYETDPARCDPEAGRFSRSGISPLSKTECDAVTGYCLLVGKNVPAYKE